MLKVRYRVFLLLSLTFLLANVGKAQHRLDLRLRVPAGPHKNDTLYVAGSFNNWDPGNKDYQLSGSGTIRSFSLGNLPAGTHEFKITRGTWDKVMATADGSDAANYVFALSSDSSLDLNIAAWKDDFKKQEKRHTASPNVTVMDTAFLIPQLNRKRRIWLYLPSSYHTGTRRYPVLYLQDGQNVFDEFTAGFGEWGVDECLDSLMKKGKNECIVIAIDNGARRLNEYNPFDNERFGPGEGEGYAAFLATTLKPYIDNHYRTMKEPVNSIVAGSSMGGLISYYTLLRYPQVFGKAGVFSPAFWTAPGIRAATDSLAKGAKGKFFFYMGALEGKEYMEDMYQVMQELGTHSSALLYSVTDPEGQHNEAAWRKWFPEFFRFITADWTNFVIPAGKGQTK